MNEHERAHVVDLLIESWPSGPRGRIWSDVVLDLDHAYAYTAYRRMREHSTRASVAEFLGYYRAARGDAQAANWHDEPTCDVCAGDGWITVDYEIDDRPYRGVEPCAACAPKRDTERVWATVRNSLKRDTGALA